MNVRFLKARRAPRADFPHLLPDSGGRIGHLLLQYGVTERGLPLRQEARAALLEVYRTLFSQMDERTEFTLFVTDSASKRQVQEVVDTCGMKNPKRVTIAKVRPSLLGRLIPKGKDALSMWMRDSMVPLRYDDGQVEVLVPNREDWCGRLDKRVPKVLGRLYPNVVIRPERDVFVDGGNVLSNGDFGSIGCDSVEKTRSKKDAASFLEQRLGTPLSVVSPQPAFHIDMAETLIGTDTVFVGDPSLALTELKKATTKERSTWNRNLTGAIGLSPYRDVLGELEEVNRDDPEGQQSAFDALAAMRKAQGFKVERVPYLTGIRRGYELPYTTYNNCLLEDYVEGGKRIRKVYLPQYGIDSLDSMARRRFEAKGFKVIPLNLAAVAVYEGAIRCISQVLERA